jgi:predicted histidine transporter YuiF (NhaC family)
MINKLLGSILLSSQDPTKLSLTVRGLLITLVPVILIAAQAFGLGMLAESDVVAIIEGITAIIATVLTLIGMVMTVVGLIRKMFNPADIQEFTESGD